MKKGQLWTNRVVGATDAGHNAYRTNSNTLQRDNLNGAIIYPKHVHQALRNYLGLGGTASDERLTFHNTEN